MPGSYAGNLKEGSRSELLADYLFSQLGAVTPVRRQDDIGVDLYCTLSDRIGPLNVVRDYFVVQVKSGLDPWLFKDELSVKWLVEYPNPLFLACVDKKKGSVAVYHVMPRFHLWALGTLPKELSLQPEEYKDGTFVRWESGEFFSLSAPIIHATISDLTNDDTMDHLGAVLRHWVSIDRDNCDLIRQGLLRFRMPDSYRVNEIPARAIGELGYAMPEPKFLDRGIARLAESAECIGGQLFRLGDRSGALRALLLVYHLWKKYPEVLGNQPRWRGSIPGDLGTEVCRLLNDNVLNHPGGYLYEGLDAVLKTLESDAGVARFLGGMQRSK